MKEKLSKLGELREAIATKVLNFFEPVMRDGTIKAAAYQGIEELASATKAFPDSLQTNAMGTVFHPLASQLAKDRGVFDRESNDNAMDQVMKATEQRQAEVADDRDGLGR
jgi:hypothetical protein